MKNINAFVKIFLAVVIFINITVISAFAFATKRPEFIEKKIDYRSEYDVWYDDFSTYQEGKQPKNFNIVERTGVTLNISSAETPDYKEKNVFKITDKDAPSYGDFTIKVPQVKNSFTFVSRFRLNETEPGEVPQFIFYGGTPNTNAFYVWYLADEFCIVNRTPTTTRNNFMQKSSLECGVWYTLKLRVELESKTVAIYLQGDTMKKESVQIKDTIRSNIKAGEFLAEGIAWSTDYTMDKINELTFRTYTKSVGEIEFDYMKIEADSPSLELKKEVYPKLPFATSLAPVVRPLQGVINLTLNGEYFNFVNRPYIMDDLIMIKARDFAKLNRLVYTITADDEIILKDDSNEIRMKIGTSEATVNGNKVPLPVNIGKNTFIPLNEFGKLMNMTVNYNQATNTVEIIK